MRFVPGPLRTRASAQRTAQDFANLVAEVVNATVSQAPIAFTEVTGGEFGGVIAHHGAHRLPEPLQLVNGEYLFIRQTLGLRRDPPFLTTLDYSYRYQASQGRESWIWRYEYTREPEARYPYPRAHLHVNARPASYQGAKSFPDLHLPIRRRTRPMRQPLRRRLHKQGRAGRAWGSHCSRLSRREMEQASFAHRADARTDGSKRLE